MPKLAEVLVTPTLAERPAHRIDSAADLASTRAFGRALAGGPAALQRTLCAEAVRRCGAQSAGLSVFEPDPLDELTWVAVDGVMSPFEGGRFPRRYSMCGICLERRAPQLFINPHTYFTWLQATGAVIAEALVVPLFDHQQHLYGTLWVMHHEAGRPFDRNDVTTLERLASYAAVSQGMV